METNVADYVLPGGTDGVLEEGRRTVLLGLKHPEGWPLWLVRLCIWLNRPFGVSSGYAELRPWLSVPAHLTKVEHGEILVGPACLSVGEVPSVRGREPGASQGGHR